MPRPRTVALLATLTAVLIAALAAAGCGGAEKPGDLPEPVPLTPAEPPPATTEGPPATTATTTTQTEREPPETEPATTEAESPEILLIRVIGGEPVDGVQKLQVNSGERVQFVVKADAPDEVHVHAYDVSKNVGPGQDARFNFPADLEGVFEVELENAGVEILQLVVEP